MNLFLLKSGACLYYNILVVVIVNRHCLLLLIDIFLEVWSPPSSFCLLQTFLFLCVWVQRVFLIISSLILCCIHKKCRTLVMGTPLIQHSPHKEEEPRSNYAAETNPACVCFRKSFQATLRLCASLTSCTRSVPASTGRGIRSARKKQVTVGFMHAIYGCGVGSKPHEVSLVLLLLKPFWFGGLARMLFFPFPPLLKPCPSRALCWASPPGARMALRDQPESWGPCVCPYIPTPCLDGPVLTQTRQLGLQK